MRVQITLVDFDWVLFKYWNPWIVVKAKNSFTSLQRRRMLKCVGWLLLFQYLGECIDFGRLCLSNWFGWLQLYTYNKRIYKTMLTITECVFHARNILSMKCGKLDTEVVILFSSVKLQIILCCHHLESLYCTVPYCTLLHCNVLMFMFILGELLTYQL